MKLRLPEDVCHSGFAKKSLENFLLNTQDRIWFSYISTNKYLTLPQELERNPLISAWFFIPKNWKFCQKIVIICVKMFYTSLARLFKTT